ncbi:DUF2071 domain-containing protein [Streptomyces sp.]|uniref:DUF2071 domain-containing protein n=1 Tax=Streptomyces sp. TaxID=1931 RepID=UPI0028128279|nr:DUF2071 domain-containing protein [Streptomyces sp.]
MGLPALRAAWLTQASAHRPCRPGAVEALLPEELVVNEYDGAAWVGLTPFVMAHRVDAHSTVGPVGHLLLLPPGKGPARAPGPGHHLPRHHRHRPTWHRRARRTVPLPTNQRAAAAQPRRAPFYAMVRGTRYVPAKP